LLHRRPKVEPFARSGPPRLPALEPRHAERCLIVVPATQDDDRFRNARPAGDFRDIRHPGPQSPERETIAAREGGDGSLNRQAQLSL
jgi:hypothetical protein